MRKIIAGLLFATTAVVGVNNADAVITGSAHDFSAEAWSGGKICEVCHIPHNASSNPYLPLWGHDSTQVNYQDNLTTFFGTTWGSVNGPSLICLSCHDGTVALDSFGGNIGTEFIDPEYDIVQDDSTLAGNHPVSVPYDETLTEEFNSEQAVIAAGLKLFNIETSADIECGSCHDVHNSSNLEDLLWVSNSGSALCLACHNK